MADKIEMIPCVDCRDLPNEIEDFISEKYDYGCHYNHTVLQIENNPDNLFTKWLVQNGYVFKSVSPGFDLVALYGT